MNKTMKLGVCLMWVAVGLRAYWALLDWGFTGSGRPVLAWIFATLAVLLRWDVLLSLAVALTVAYFGLESALKGGKR
jgi:hypothetical protein